MNEFGTPMNEAELSMQPKPGKAFVQEQLSTSGMEIQIADWIIGAAISTVGSFIGGSKAAGAARDQARLNNEASQRALGYDLERWEMDKQKILADRDFAVETIETQARNEGKVA